jgi:cell division protein FtsX
MANRRSFLAALWDGDLVGAAGALVAGILHMIVMLVFLLVLTAVSPIPAVAMPFIAYQMSGDDVQLLALVYFILGAFPLGCSPDSFTAM